MAELKLIKMSDIKPLTEVELRIALAKDKAKYKKMLLEICPDKEMRQKARRISVRKEPCDNCVYYDGESPMCWYPHSDAYIEDLKINPCYEGVLRFLVKGAEEKRTDDKIDAKLADTIKSLKSAKDMVFNNMAIIGVLTGWILRMTDENWEIPPAIVSIVRELDSLICETLPVEYDGTDGGDSH